jgi:hypothetical protein
MAVATQHLFDLAGIGFLIAQKQCSGQLLGYRTAAFQLWIQL